VQASVNCSMLLSSIAVLFLLAAILIAGFASSSLVMAQQTGATTTTTTPPSETTTLTAPSPPSPPLTPEEQEQQTRLQNVMAATTQNLDETEKQIGGVVYTPRWSEPLWVEPGASSIVFAYCLPGEFAESGHEILGGFELEVLESYPLALPQNFMAWMMVVGNEDRQDRIPAAVGVVCASDANNAETRVLSPEEEQQINNVISQFTQVTSIDQVINIINNATTSPPQNGNSTNTRGGGGGGQDTTPPVLTVPNNMVLETTSEFGADLLYMVTARDDIDGTATLDEGSILTQDNLGGSITISCNPISQHPLPSGTHTVQCTATDSSGNRGTASFTVSVTTTTPVDTTPPVITGPGDLVLDATSPAGYDIGFDVYAKDDVDGTAVLTSLGNLINDGEQGEPKVGEDIIISCNPATNSLFPVGDTTLQCTATDSSGNVGTASYTITVRGPGTALAQEQPPAEEEGEAPAEEDTTTDEEGAGAGGTEDGDGEPAAPTTDEEGAAEGGGGGTDGGGGEPAAPTTEEAAAPPANDEGGGGGGG
jgi:hypothetical protein